MSTTQYLLNAALLAWVLLASLGTRPLTNRRLLQPLAIVVVVAAVFLRSVPTAGNDVALELAGAAAGVALGALAAAVMRVERSTQGGLVTRAGGAFAAVWVLAIGGRVLFAYGADHWFTQPIVRFSLTHQITGADAWTAAFVLMALAMVTTRTTVTAVRAWRPAGRTVPVVG